MDVDEMATLTHFIIRQLRGFAVLYALRLVVDAVEDITRPRPVDYVIGIDDVVFADGTSDADVRHFQWNRCEFWTAALVAKVSIFHWL